MPGLNTNNYPGIGFSNGRIHDIYQQFVVIGYNFGDQTLSGAQPDFVPLFSVQSWALQTEGTLATHLVEFSLNGITVAGQLSPVLPSRAQFYDNRPLSKIWFRLASGSVGPVTVDLTAWAIR